jgi:uncharacterized protein YcnI
VNDRRLTRALAVAAVAVMAAAPTAAAHVTVNPGEAPKGGFTTLAFRVPNERDESTTIKVEVNLPEDHPVRSVRVRPTPGWEYEIKLRKLDEPLVNDEGEETTEVVGKITWTGSIGTTEYQEFEVSAGPLPEDVDQITFPSIQTYASGEVVRWIDEPVEEGEDEPERPAPLLNLVDPEEEGEAGSDDDAGGDGSESEAASGLTVENAASQDDVDSANTLATVGVAVGVIGLLVAVLALMSGRRRAS